MNTQLSLEEYKARVLEWHERVCPNAIAEREHLKKMKDEDWQYYMDDWSPEDMVGAMNAGA